MSTPDTTETFVKQFNAAYEDKYINEIPKEKYENILKDIIERRPEICEIFKRNKDQKITAKSQMSYYLKSSNK
jgi:hypothetical protein